MNPPYQRKGNLWKVQDMQSLIDTMINGYDMPKLYVADFTTLKSDMNKAGMRYAVIDGKQRLQAIFDFLSNKFALSENFILEEDSDVDLAGLYHKDIAENYPLLAERVEEFPMPIIHVVTDEPLKIRELFLRLNKGVVLTGPEKRNAMKGNVPASIKEVSEHEFFQICVSYKDTRGENQNNAAKILSFELNRDVTETKRVNLDKMVAEYADKAGELNLAVQYCDENLSKMAVVFGERDKLLRSAGSVPAFYWFIRSIDDDRLKLTRPYLEIFMNKIGGKPAPAILTTNQVAQYKGLLRNINDRGSHEERVRILIAGFAKWIELPRKRG
jgi:hypothetical protein